MHIYNTLDLRHLKELKALIFILSSWLPFQTTTTEFLTFGKKQVVFPWTQCSKTFWCCFYEGRHWFLVKSRNKTVPRLKCQNKQVYCQCNLQPSCYEDAFLTTLPPWRQLFMSCFIIFVLISSRVFWLLVLTMFCKSQRDTSWSSTIPELVLQVSSFISFIWCSLQTNTTKVL